MRTLRSSRLDGWIETMSAPIAKTHFSFELPKLSYVDARWEEPNRVADVPAEKPHGFSHWLAGLVASFRGWRERQVAMNELSLMTDRELMDIGLNRGDLGRVFATDFRQGA